MFGLMMGSDDKEIEMFNGPALVWLRRVNQTFSMAKLLTFLHQRKRTWTPVQVAAGTLLDGGEEVIQRALASTA